MIPTKKISTTIILYVFIGLNLCNAQKKSIAKNMKSCSKASLKKSVLILDKNKAFNFHNMIKDLEHYFVQEAFLSGKHIKNYKGFINQIWYKDDTFYKNICNDLSQILYQNNIASIPYNTVLQSCPHNIKKKIKNNTDYINLTHILDKLEAFNPYSKDYNIELVNTLHKGKYNAIEFRALPLISIVRYIYHKNNTLILH